MRISIRRCLSMLRNTSDGNELAVPLPMPWKEHSVGCLQVRVAAHALVCRGSRPVAALAYHVRYSTAAAIYRLPTLRWLCQVNGMLPLQYTLRFELPQGYYTPFT